MLARTRRVLLLTAACVAGLELRATAQSESPVVPSGADPAAILLAPVLTQPHPAGRGSDLPTPVERIPSVPVEPAARLAPIGDTGIVRVSDFDSARRVAADLPDLGARPRAASTDDAFEFLTDGKLRRTDTGKLTRKPKFDDDEPNTRRSEQLGDKMEDILGGKGGFFNRDRGLFKSDCEFDNFVSPVTNPFLFEDPRSLTEVRMVFLYQKIPGNSGLFQGGSAWFVGAQGRLAITNRLSLVVNKFGLTGFSPGSGSPIDGGTGFSEIHLGPKFVVYRDPESKTLITLGGTFQLPSGSSKVFQDTGRLSIVPYVSAGRRLYETKLGTLNGLASSGYSFSTNNARSDYFYVSGHLDFDVGNRGRIFPLVEMNWIRYTSDGKSTNLGVEGRDLANFGSPRAGSGMLTIAAGARVKITDNWQAGGAFEFPLVGSKDIFQYRMTFDLIWRY